MEPSSSLCGRFSTPPPYRHLTTPQAALKSAYKTLSDVFIEDSEASRKESGDLRSSLGGATHKIALLQDGQEKLELYLRGADVKVRGAHGVASGALEESKHYFVPTVRNEPPTQFATG